jgi:methylated-DNA-protein-cysteine methyltransferase-like protein
MMMTRFSESVIEVIKSIPEGKVLSYGAVAKIAGSSKAARQVTRILYSCSEKYDLPWHRVVSSKGMISFKDEDAYLHQKLRLLNEGIRFDENDKIDLNTFLWNVD